MLEFAGAKRGQRVLDLAAGAGYYSEILVNAVGASGRVTLHNSLWVVGKFGNMGIPDRLKKPNMANVTYLEASLDALMLAPDSVEVALIVLFYHDTYWQKTDGAAMNRSLLEALAPGGTFLVIDHHAQAGSGARDVESIHRIDAEGVKRDIVAAGFEFDGESDVLCMPDDDRSLGGGLRSVDPGRDGSVCIPLSEAFGLLIAEQGGCTEHPGVQRGRRASLEYVYSNRIYGRSGKPSPEFARAPDSLTRAVRSG